LASHFRRRLNIEPDAECAFVQLFLNRGFDIFLECRGVDTCIASRRGNTRILHHRRSYWHWTGAGAVVDERLALTRRIPFLDGQDPGFKLKSRCDAVHGLVAIVFQILTMLVQVNKAGRNYEPSNINLNFALEPGGGYCSDPAASDTDI